MAASELSNSKPGIGSVLWALLILFLIVIITWTAICVYRSSSAYDAERVKKRYENLKKLNADNQKKLIEYAWVDKAKGTVQLPIDQAMLLAVRELAVKKPMVANLIATPSSVPVTPATSIVPEVPVPSTPTVIPAPAANTPVAPLSLEVPVAPVTTIGPAPEPTPNAAPATLLNDAPTPTVSPTP